VCLKGRYRIVLDDRKDREKVWLVAVFSGLIVNELIWREMHNFSEDCVLLVIVDAPNQENDYISD